MAPTSTQTCFSYESGEGITIMRHLLNGFHCPRGGLCTELFFEEDEVYSLVPTWTSQIPITVETNMLRDNWFTSDPFLAESGISSSNWSQYRRSFPLMNNPAWVQWINELKSIFKRKWMNNGIYELIMLSKTTVVAKPELLTTTILFWNSGTNTFDFRMGPISQLF